jgi:type I restriction enzyme, S subunit
MIERATMPLTDVLEFREGPGIMARDFRDSGVPLLRLAGLKTGAPLLEGCNFLDPRMVDAKWNHFRVEVGDVLLSTSASLGEVASVDESAVGAVPYTGIINFRPRDDRMSPRFIRFALTERSFKLQVEAMGVGSVMRHFGPSHLRKMTVTVPPLAVQEGIADVLGALDDKIAANGSFMQATEDLLAARFAALRLDEEPGPDDDQVIRLDDLIEMNPKVPAPSESEPVYVDMKKLPVTGMSIAQWTHRPAKGGARFQNGDTLMARITPCLENRKTGYVDFLDEGQVAIGSTEYIVMRSRPGVPSGLSFFLAISDRFRAFGIRHMLGTTGRQRLSAGDLRDYRLRATDNVAFESFGLASKPLLALVRSRTAETRTLIAMRDALLPQLMSGKIRVKDAEQRVGDVA